MEHRINVSQPDLTDRERAYLLDAFDSSWISSTGEYVGRFEESFAEFAAVRHAITCSNGTCALHLALMALEVGPGDEVIVPDMTFVSTANAVRYVGAEPVFADCDRDTWNIDPDSVRRLLSDRTRAIIAVHLLGVPADVEALLNVAADAGYPLIEDAAEAHGATWAGRPVGSWGTLSTFSFYGNKVLTTGEGGMVCTDDDRLAARVRKLRGQGVNPDRPYWFDEVGYNYRMTNLACAIGLAQLERFQELRARRARVRACYDDLLSRSDLPIARQQTPAQAEAVDWICGVVLDEELAVSRDEVAERMARAGIETRPFFHPLSSLPIYRGCRTDGGCPHSRRLGNRGLMLPTHTQLAREDADRVVEALRIALEIPVETA